MATRVFKSPPTLVKYTNPVLVQNKELTEKTVQKETPLIQSPKFVKDLTYERSTDTQAILDCILPPREWEENGQLWRQQVSSEPATKTDVLKLGETLDRRLQQGEAKETGICAVRRQLYTQAFDEVIRQVTVNCAERGMLLLRVRDELRVTAASYQSLYESSIAYGMRKALLGEKGKSDYVAEMEKLTDEKHQLKLKLMDLKIKYEYCEKRSAELRAAEEKKYADEIATIKRINAQVKSQIENIVAPKK